MGVAGLWDILRPAGKTRSLTDISVTEGFEANPGGVRGFRIGIDASIWFFHAEYGKEGENPVLRTLFFRCATLMHSPFLPLFVFDGPKRPDFKRGKKINKTSNKLIPGMKAIVESFGFEWRMAPGEAEAELAYLNRVGVIDGVLSDDVDNFLFGATTVIRNPSNNLSGNRANPVVNAAGKDDKNHTKVYRLSDITEHPDIRLTRGGMILIGLMKGGDYHPGGLARCGTVIAHGLARCGFGDTLYEAAKNLSRSELVSFLVHWRHELKYELSTNSQGHIGKKQPSLAKSLPESFPDIDILLSYTNPITSESMGRESNNLKLTWGKEPDLGKLAATCEFYFEWGYKEAIIKRFRTVIWHSAVLRILRRAVLDLDAKTKPRGVALPLTPRKNREESEAIGTPSKMIADRFSSLTLGAVNGWLSDCDDDPDECLIIKIHSERNHVSTDGILEYRLEIAPAQLVRIAESGIKGTRTPEGPDEWADEDGEEDGGAKGAKSPPPDPDSHMRVWMPACMVRLVEPKLVGEYEALLEKKRIKKASKGGTKRGGKAKAITATTTEADEMSASSGGDDLPTAKPVFKPKPGPTESLPVHVSIGDVHKIPSTVSNEAPPPRIIRDLTKKKLDNATARGDKADLKSFFAVAKPSKNTKLKPKTKNGLVVTASIKTSKSDRISSDEALDYPYHLMSAPVPVPGSSAPPKHFKEATHGSSRPHPSKIHRVSTKLPDLFSNDDRLFESDDPFDGMPPRTSLHKLTRKKPLVSSSDSEPTHSHIKKSPRKTSEHASPRSKRTMVHDRGTKDEDVRRDIRPCSPSPLRPLVRKQNVPASPTRRTITQPLQVIEISSDSEDEPASAEFFPLRLAQVRAQLKERPTKPANNTQFKNNRILKSTTKVNLLTDVIDLT